MSCTSKQPLFHSMTRRSPCACYQIHVLRVAHVPGPECRERFPCHRLQRKPLVSDPDMHHGTCVTQVSWCMSGSLTRGCGENVPGTPGACATLNLTDLTRAPWPKRLTDASLTRSHDLVTSSPSCIQPSDVWLDHCAEIKHPVIIFHFADVSNYLATGVM